MDPRVVGVDAFGVDVQTEVGYRAHRRSHRDLGRRRAGVAAGREVGGGIRCGSLTAPAASRCCPTSPCPGHPEVFAVGDMVSLDKLPGVAEVAMQGSLHAAHSVGRRLRGHEDAKPFHYRDLGSVATIGRFRAIFSWRRIRLSGAPAWVVWMFVHLAFLNGFGSRFTTMMRWLRWMIGRNRVERTFSVSHTGGDLSAPDGVREQIVPNPFPQMKATLEAEAAAQSAPPPTS